MAKIKKNETAPEKTVVLLDVHAIIHRAYHALPDFASAKGEPTGALYGLITMLIGVIQKFDPDFIFACFDLPQPTYRHIAYKDYKAGRQKTDDALVSQIIRSRDVFAAFNIPMFENPGFEADDLLGTAVEQLKGLPGVNIVIASGDMDTLQLVEGKKVRVFTLKKGIKDTVVYDEAAVQARFGFGPLQLPSYKGLRGDPSDNIIGIKGIGEKTATTLIQTFGSIDGLYEAVHKKPEALAEAGLSERMIDLIKNGEDEARFSTMLATIRRDAPATFALDTPWKGSISLEKLTAMCQEFDFRSLAPRLRAIFGQPSVEVHESSGNPTYGDTREAELTDDPSTPSLLTSAPRDISDTELEHALLALWIVDSTKINPQPEDLLMVTGETSYKAAYQVIMARLKAEGGEKVFNEIELPLIPVIKRLNARGLAIDVPHVHALKKEYDATLAKLEKDIWQAAGKEFNVASPKQLGEVLFTHLGLAPKRHKKTAGGAFSTKESELEKIKDMHPVVAMVLEYRERAKLRSTYIDVILERTTPEGRLHTTLIQAGASTGRMASENPNLQNIPNKTELGRAIRRSFIAGPGYDLVAFDYSQMELRIAAFLSEDEALLEIFRKGEDVHTAVAAQVFKVPLNEVTKDMRRQAKVINFGVMYGMGVTALQGNLGTDRATAQKFYDDYFTTFSGLALYLKKVAYEAGKRGYTETLFGRRRYMPELRSHLPYIRAQAERMATNAPIQGTGADIVKRAMIAVDDYVERNNLQDDVRMLLQVHDELLFEIKPSAYARVEPEITRLMESVVPLEQTKGVVCKVDSKRGKNWSEMKE